MEVSELEDGSLSLEGRIPFRGFDGAGCHYDYSRISITNVNALPAKYARALSRYKEVEKLWIWCDVYRTAIQYVLSSPKLRVVDMLGISRPGRKIPNFDFATELEEFRCNNGLIQSDLVAISKGPRLRELGAQWSELTSVAIDSLLENPTLESLDLECAGVTDSMAEQLSQSCRLVSLELGNNPITVKGLTAISNMAQLRRLDVWLINATASDIEVLAGLENLEYISIGGSQNEVNTIDGNTIFDVLKSFKSLKSVWLDGVTLTQEQKDELNERYETFRN